MHVGFRWLPRPACDRNHHVKKSSESAKLTGQRLGHLVVYLAVGTWGELNVLNGFARH